MTRCPHLVATVLPLVLCMACGDGGSDTAVTTTTTTTATTTSTSTSTLIGAIGAVSVFCDSTTSPPTWVYELEDVIGATGVVNAWETGVTNGWNEEHTLEAADLDGDGTVDGLDRHLISGVATIDQVKDVSTVFACGVHDVSPTMTYAVRVYDADGSLAACSIYSTDTVNGGVDDVFGGLAPDTNSVTDLSEISAANCTVL